MRYTVSTQINKPIKEVWAAFDNPANMTFREENGVTTWASENEFIFTGFYKLLGLMKGTFIKQTNPEIKKIKLSVNKDQIPAVNLYKKFGFEVVDTENAQLGDGNFYDEYLMEKSL
jgi:hypothetical protein